MHILLNDPARANELASAFQDAGCEAERVEASVVIPPDVPRADVVFFVRAWRNHRLSD